jgi:superfamily II DNA helicase RecQ
MYHSETPDENKKLIVEALRSENSNKRLILSTSALGMGIDVVGCNSVVLYGPPRNVVDLIQSIGRIGRDGEQSIAIIMYNSYQCRNVDQDMKSFITCQGCRRKNLMSNFMSNKDLLELEKDVNVHTCCDICTNVCKCSTCSVLQLEKLCSNEYLNSDSSSGSDTVDYEYDMVDDNSDNELCEALEACDVE